MSGRISLKKTTRKSALCVDGSSVLSGQVQLSGFKHAAIPIIASSLLTDKPVFVQNAPDIKDVQVLRKVIETLGGKTSYDGNTLSIVNKQICDDVKLPSSLVSSVHGSMYILPALLARKGAVEVSRSGGCSIGRRPIINVVAVLRRLGAKVKLRRGVVKATAKKLIGNNINLQFNSAWDKYRSGATKTALIAGAKAIGDTVVENAYNRIEVKHIIQFLRRLGCIIKEDDSGRIVIHGADELKGGRFHLMSDLMEFGTFIAAAAVSRSSIEVKGFQVKGFDAELKAFEDMGIDVKVKDGAVRVSCCDRPQAINITTESIYTDLHPIFASVMATARGISSIEEVVWENRFRYVHQLKKMGAKLRVHGNMVELTGVKHLNGRVVKATDLRAAAALVLVGLGAKGSTKVLDYHHLDRGYEDLVGKLKQLKARIMVREKI